MNKRFKFTNERLRALPPNPIDSASTDLEVSDTEISGLKCLSGKSGAKRFLLRYKTIEGRKRSIAIGRFPDINVATARKVARKFKADIAEGRDPKAVREDRLANPTLAEFFWQTYLPMAKKRKSSYNHDIQRFRDHIEPALGTTRYKELTAAQVQQLQISLNTANKQRKAYAPSTCNRVLAILKTMGNHALRLGVVDHNEAMKIPLLREDNVRTRFLDIDESRRVIEVARRFENKSIGALIALLLISGCRSSELRKATWKQLDAKSCIITVPPSNTKNRKGRIVYLSALAMEIINDLPRVPGNPYIFAGRKPGKYVTDGRIAFRKILTAAGIERPEELCFHSLRHSAASCLIAAGFTLNDVKSQLAHSSITSSERYAKTSVTRLQHTADTMAGLLGQN